MIRTILGVIIGYVVMVVVIFITLTASYMTLGMDKTFQTGSYDLTPQWLVVQLAFTLVAGIVAGKVCRVISGRGWSLIPFVVVAVAIGLLVAIPALLAPAVSAIRTGDVSNWQAMLNGRAPKWFALLTPFISAIGIVMGGRSKRK